jgi:hypothetical protein
MSCSIFLAVHSMRQMDKSTDKLVKAYTLQYLKKVCKTFIHRFDSGPRLQIKQKSQLLRE